MTLLLWIGSLVGCSETSLTKAEPREEDGLRVLEVSPEDVDFGAVSGTRTQVVRLESVGDLPVTLTSLALTGSPAFTVTNVDGADTLEAGEGADLLVTYTPASPADSASLVVRSDATEPEQVVPLQGAGLYPMIEVDPPSIELRSNIGEPVDTEVLIRSVGTAPLEVSSLLLTHPELSLDLAAPLTLDPGEEQALTLTWTPTAVPETFSTSLWVGNNSFTPDVMVPIFAQAGEPCVGLGEAWDRGWLRVYTPNGSSLYVVYETGKADLCFDRWYVYTSPASQDAAAGDPYFDLGSPYPMGTLVAGPGVTTGFRYQETDANAWYCVERDQLTQGGADYVFTGGHPPDVVLDSMLAGDQDSVWDWQSAEPLVIAARDRNWADLSASPTTSMELRVFNMGDRGADGTLYETVPAGFEASDFSPAPATTTPNGDGSVTYTFPYHLGARVNPGDGSNVTYPEERVRYQLTVTSGCGARVTFPELVADWADSSDTRHLSTANPFVVDCF